MFIFKGRLVTLGMVENGVLITFFIIFGHFDLFHIEILIFYFIFYIGKYILGCGWNWGWVKDGGPNSRMGKYEVRSK